MQTKFNNLPEGFFTIVYPSGDYRTMRVETGNGFFADKKIIGFLTGPNNEADYTNFGHVDSFGNLAFWRKFSATQTPERLQRIRRAVEIIANEPKEAGKAYAMHSGKCWRCNRTLTTPESIANGIGPICAEKLGM